eukprot:gene23775-9334_t
MEGNFVADVRVDDSDEVLQLPIVRRRLKNLLGKAVGKMALLGAPVIIPSSEDSLEEFLASAGKYFGKDPSKWESVGETQIEITDQDGRRYIKNTGTFSGTELHLYVEQPYYDDRLPVREDKPELNFNQKKIEVVLMVYLHAKLEADDGDLAMEGCHGFWEMSINKEPHLDIRMDRMAALLGKLSSNNIQVATLAAAAVWGLATTGTSRRNLSELDVISLVVSNLKRSLKLIIVDPNLEDPPAGSATDTQRSLMQRNLLGGLAVLLIDRCCRRPYLSLEPDFHTLFGLLKDLDDYAERDAQTRRETAAKVLASLVQRDADARHSLVSSGSLKSVLANIDPTGPGSAMIQFCMASLLATLVLDDEAMAVIRERGEAPVLFETCLLLLSSTLDKLRDELERQLGNYYETDDEPPLYDLALGVRLAEASSQAMWGSAHTCVTMKPIQIKMSHVERLGTMGIDCFLNEQLPLSRVCHCIAATLATLSSVHETAELVMTSPGDGALKTLITLLEVYETDVFDRAGHVKAAACAGVAFLTCHPIGAKGDDCMHGPYRTKLLEMGAFGALLRAALTSVDNEECDMIVQQVQYSGAFLSCSRRQPCPYVPVQNGGSHRAGELAMYSALLMDSDNSEMIEFLMAGMWILLRNPDNRRVLGSSFNQNPALQKSGHTAMAGKLQDAIQVHDVNEQADAIRRVATGTNMRVPPHLLDQVERAAVEEDSWLERDQDAPLGAEPAQEEDEAEAEAVEEGQAGAGEGEAAGAEGDALGEESPGLAEEAAAQEGVPAGENEDATHLSQGEAPEGAPAGENEDATHLPHNFDEAKGDKLLEGQGVPRMSNNMVGASSSRAATTAVLADDETGPPPGSADSSKRKAEATQEVLDERFDKQLKENWGLETLVTVGESWLPAMLEQDNDGDATDVPVLKLFEFLVASICLFMIEDKPDPERRELDMFRMSAPAGVENRTWWTVDAHAPEPDSGVDENTERALNILVKIIGMRLQASWKSVQLGALTIWNAASRNPCIERNVVEKGIAFRLVDIINTISWPPSLRETAGGLLEFLSERYSSLQFFLQVGLPQDIEWPYQNAPPPGMVPVLAAHINLINSRLPILEYRGCHAIARMCFAHPYRCPDGKSYVRDAKAVSAVLGAVDALVALIKRVNKRYEDVLSAVDALVALIKRVNKRYEDVLSAVDALVALINLVNKGYEDMLSGQVVRLKRMAMEAKNEGEEDPAQFEKDMTSVEATQDVYFVLFGALLNISVLRSVQPMVARKGLLVLLGTNTLFYQRVTAAAERGQDTAQEEKLLHLCSSVIQNISLHPQNRTRLYKAELKGSTALEKMIEDAMADDDNSVFFTGPSDQPSLSQSSPPASRSSQGGRRPATNHVSRSLVPSSQQKKRVANPKTAPAHAQRPPQYSRNGGVLNVSVDTALSKTMAARPKAMFPPILEKKEPVWAIGDKSLQQSASRANMSRQSLSRNQTSRESEKSGAGKSESGQHHDDGEHENSPRPNESTDGGDPSEARHKFLNWLDNTFHGGEDGGGSSMGGGEKVTARRKMWDQNGDWLENEPATSRSLNRLLCKPLNQMWKEAPEARARHGQARWEPTVSEYHEASPQTPFTRQAAKLLTTQLPKSQDTLMVAAVQMISTGKFDDVEADVYQATRPPTATRNQGRLGLTILKPNPEIVLQAQAAAAARMEAEEAGISMGGTAPSEAVASPRAASASVPLKVCIGPQRPRQVMPLKVCIGPQHPRQVMPLKVCISPQRPRQVMPLKVCIGPQRPRQVMPLEVCIGPQRPRQVMPLKVCIGPQRPRQRPRQVMPLKVCIGPQRPRQIMPLKVCIGPQRSRQVMPLKVCIGPQRPRQVMPLKVCIGPQRPRQVMPLKVCIGPQRPRQVMPLKVCIGPQRPRQVMSFEDRILLNDDASRPTLTVFEHVEGSKVCQGMFPSYQLPNGKQTYMYYNGGTLLDEVQVDAVQPPPRPTTVPEALQQSMPLADVLALIAKPPGSAPPFIPYKPVPYLVPLPSRHTVNVKHPEVLSSTAFGEIREDNLQLVIMANRIIKQQSNTRVEAITMVPVEERDPWQLPLSIFKARAKEADCRTWHDTDAVETKMFERDWQRATSKEKFTSMLSREHKANKHSGNTDDKDMLQEVHDVLLHNYQVWYSSFLYYGARSSSDPYHMSLNSYTSFLDECQIADSESQFIKRSDCDTVFIVCNFQPDKKSMEAQVNVENAMMRFVFLEALVRLAIAKYDY